MEVKTAPITSTHIRQILKRWHYAELLGQHELAALTVVARRQRDAGHADTAVGRGLALKAVLNEAIEALRPVSDSGAEPDPDSKSWRPYIIITERYCLGRIPEWIMSKLHVSERTFYKGEKSGIDQLVLTLTHSEHAAKKREREREKVAAATIEPDEIGDPASHTEAANGDEVFFNGPLLPPQTIVGREGELTQAAQWLCQAEGRTIALFGLPGAGKTTLATLIAYRPEIRERFSDGIVWLGVGQQPNMEQLLRGLAQQLGVPSDQTDLSELTGRVRDKVVDARLLFILDDVWERETALSLCLGGVDAKHLITTRQSAIATELAGSFALPINSLPPAGGQKLLEQLAPQALRDKGLLAQLQTRVGGLPLALVMIGKQLSRHPHLDPATRAQGLLDRLQARASRLSLEMVRPSATLPDQFETVSLGTVIGQSVDALKPEAKRALIALTQLPPKPNSFSQRAALAITRTTADTLETLLDIGLLEPAASERLTLHQLIHDFVVDREQRGATVESRLAFCAYFALLLEETALGNHIIEREETNLQAALQTAVNLGEIDLLARMLFHFVPYLIDRGRLHEARAWFETPLITAATETKQPAAARLLVTRGRLEQWEAKYKEALMTLRAGEGWAERFQLDTVVLVAQMRRLELCSRIGETTEALELARKMETTIDSYRNPYLQATVHRTMSTSYYHAGYLNEAYDHVHKARHLFEALNDTASLGRVYQNLGVFCVERGRYNTAQLYYEMALAKYEATGNQTGMGHIYNNLGVLALNTGQWQRAEAYHQRALERREMIGYVIGQVQSLNNLGIVALSRRDHQTGSAYLEAGLQMANQHALNPLRAKLFINLSWAKREEESFDDALLIAQEALGLSLEIDQRQLIGECHYQIGLAYAGLGQNGRAIEALEEAITIWAARDQPQLLAETNVHLARIYLVSGNEQRAAERLDAALPYIEDGTDGFEEPADILSICARLSLALGRADEGIAFQARTALYIRRQLEQIDDPQVRERFAQWYGRRG